MSTHPDSDAFPEQKWNTALWDRIFESGQVALVEELKPALLQWLETRPPASDANPGDSEDEVLATRIRELLAKRQC